MFKQIKEWSEMSIEKRYNFLLGLIIVILSLVVRKQHVDCMAMRSVYKLEKADLQKTIDKNKDEHLIYLREMDREYRELLKELNNLKHEKSNS